MGRRSLLSTVPHPSCAVCSPVLGAWPGASLFWYRFQPLAKCCLMAGCLNESRCGDTVRYTGYSSLGPQEPSITLQPFPPPTTLSRARLASAPASSALMLVPGSLPLGEHACVHTKYTSTHTHICTQSGTQGLDHTARQSRFSPRVCAPAPRILLTLLHPRWP